MQLVSREVLFDVMQHKKPVRFKSLTPLNEVEVDASAFQTFMHNANELYKQAEAKVKDMSISYVKSKQSDELMYQFYLQVLRFMKLNEDVIKYVNEGSSRIVFALADGTILKVAKTDAGIAQNEVEADNCMDSEVKYEIFPDFYGVDRSRWLALNCEMCASTNEEEIKRIFGVDMKNLIASARFIINKNIPDNDYAEWRDYFINDRSKDSWIRNNFKQRAKVFDGLISQNTEAFKALASLVKFWRKNGLNAMLPTDLESYANWGVTVRNNQLVPVIIDAGFSFDVADKFYR